MSEPLCGACNTPMMLINKGSRKYIIACPKGHYRLPAPSTVPGAKWFYESAAEAREVAAKLYETMNRDHPMRQGDPRIHERYRRAQRN
jgi:hypothetical protein